MAKSASDGKISNKLVAMSCAAVLTVYAAGYSRTRDAARQFETQSAERRPARGQQPTSVSGEPVSNDAAPVESRTPSPTRLMAASIPPSAEAPKAAEPAQVQVQVPTPVAPEAAVAPALPSEPLAPPPPVAVAPAPVAPVAPAPLVQKWKDGTYTGWGTSRHGDIEAQVVIKDGRIAESRISQCRTRYDCNVIDKIIQQPVQRQSPDVDYVSRATQSSDAYYYGLVEALVKASHDR